MNEIRTNSGNQVIITNNGREEVVVIGKEEYKNYERIIHSEYVRRALEIAEEEAKDPDAKWFSEEEMDKMLDEGL